MRYFIVILITTAALIGDTSCRREAGIKPDNALAAQVPADATVVFGADIAKLKAAPFYQRHAAAADIPLLDAASERLGVDPRRDIGSALVYLTHQQQPVALVHGSFGNDAVQQKLMTLGAQRAPDNRSLLQNGTEGVLFTAPGVVAIGPVQALRQRSGGSGLPQAVSARLESLPKIDQLWLVSTQGLGSLKLAGESNIAANLGMISSFVTAATVGVGVDKAIHLQADLSCVSPKGAEQVRDALRGFVALGRLTTRRDLTDL